MALELQAMHYAVPGVLIMQTGNVATNMTGGGNGCSTGNIAISNTTACNVTGQNAHSTAAPAFSCNVTGTSPTTNPPNPCNTGGGA